MKFEWNASRPYRINQHIVIIGECLSVDIIGACVPFPVRQTAQGVGREPAAVPGVAAPDPAIAQHGVW